MLAIYRLLQGILPPLGVPSARDVRGTGTVPMAGGQGHAEGGEAGSGAKLIEANGVKVAATPAWGQCPHISTLLPPSGCPQQCLCRAGRPLQPPRLCWQVCPGSTKASPLTTESHGAWGLGMAQQWVVGSSADGRAGAGWGGGGRLCDLGCWCPPAAPRGRAAGWAQCKDKALARAGHHAHPGGPPPRSHLRTQE